MKMITLQNVSELDINDYPISEPELSNGEVRFDTNGNIISTGKTLLWSIERGTKKAFPEYVADILIKRYGVEDKESGRCILKVIESETVEEKIEQVVPENGCRHCGQIFKNKRGLALHLAGKHPEKL